MGSPPGITTWPAPREVVALAHADVVDAAGWAVATGVATPGRLAVAGVSFGGLLALELLATDPSFACGLSVNGPTTLVGPGADPWPVPRRIERAHSPLHHLGDLAGPALVVQGTRDEVVDPAGADRFAATAAATGRPVILARIPGGGHAVGSWSVSDQVAEAIVEARFLAGCLGGRAEPWEALPPDATLEVPVGADLVGWPRPARGVP